MTVEVPPSPRRPQRNRGTFAIALVGMVVVAFFIYINARPGGSNHEGPGVPTSIGVPGPTATSTLKPVPQGTFGANVPFTSLQGYKLTIPKGWRILPYIGPLGTDLIVQAPESKTEASVFTITVADASKRPVKDPVAELPGAAAFSTFAPDPAKRITIDGAPAASQDAKIAIKKGPARIIQFFVSHHKRAYNLVGICPPADFDKRRVQIQSMVDSLRWIPPKQPAPVQSKV